MTTFPLLNRQEFPSERVETVVVPGIADNYTYRLGYVPATNRTPFVSLAGVSSSGGGFTLVNSLPAAAGEVYLKLSTGDLLFHSSDGGAALADITATYNKLGSLVLAELINDLYTTLNSLSEIPEQFFLTYPGVPPSGAGTLMGNIFIPARGKTSRFIKRISINASDVSYITGSTELLLASSNIVTPTLVTLLSTDAYVNLITDVEVTMSDAVGEWVSVVCETVGGHGNLSISVEVF